MVVERRVNRSNQPFAALRYQLAASARRAHFSSMVLGEELGLVVADAGDAHVCEEVAALAPHIAAGRELWHGRIVTTSGQKTVTIAAVRSPHGRLYLSGVGGSRSGIVTEIERSRRGVCRILGRPSV